MSKHLSFRVSDTHAMWKRFDNDVKRTTNMFEGIFVDSSGNDNPFDYPLNFASAIKESLLIAFDKDSQVSIKFTKKHLIPSENNMSLRSYYYQNDRNAKDSPHPIQPCNNQWKSNVFKAFCNDSF